MRQKRPNYRLEFLPVELPPELPIVAKRQPDHGDRPIHCLHTHDHLELGLCHAGSGVFAVGEKVYSFAPGDAIAIPRGEPHFAQSRPGTTSDWTWVWLDADALGGQERAGLAQTDSWRGPGFENLVARREEPGWCAALALLIEELEKRRPGWREAARGLARALLVMGQRRAPRAVTKLAGGFLRLGPAIDYLGRNFREPVASEELAPLCAMSDTHFRREFRRALGKPVHRHLLELRVRAAAAEIRACGRSIAECAFGAGFESLSSFHRAFRAVLGRTPRDWVREARGAVDPAA